MEVTNPSARCAGLQPRALSRGAGSSPQAWAPGPVKKRLGQSPRALPFWKQGQVSQNLAAGRTLVDTHLRT